MKKIRHRLERLKSSAARRLDFPKSKTLEFFAPIRRAMRKNRRLEIEVITMMYNEAFLAPLFVRHYAPWVDKFTVFYSKSSDDTRAELETAAAQCGVKSLNILPFEFANGFDDMQKIQPINRAVRKSSADFAVCVDADEFVHPWPFEKTDPRAELAKERGDFVLCKLFNVFRHATDSDVDRTRPPLFQRRHGGETGEKPCIVRPDSGAQFGAGCHHLLVPKKGSTTWMGVHWGKADDFCLTRYVRDRRDRMSLANRARGHGTHHFETTEEQIRAELKARENNPRLF